VYMTAGDSGYGKFYWLSRQLGAEAAYSTMLGIPNVWDQQTVALTTGAYVTIANPRDNTRISLIFINLPDGSLHGDGFPASNHESLQKLRSGEITSLHAIDGQSSYTSEDLTGALLTLMLTYQPAEVRTQATEASEHYPDHSDHMAVSLFTQEATMRYDQQHFGGAVTIPVSRYIGYPVRDRDANVGDDDLARKRAAFFAYAHYDGGVCSSIERCSHVPTYDAYLTRQYVQAN
jgi:LmbE family N-acetylglucosaminyl deacetylase